MSNCSQFAVRRIRDAAIADDNFDSSTIIKQLYLDQETYKKEEQPRFEILDAIRICRPRTSTSKHSGKVCSGALRSLCKTRRSVATMNRSFESDGHRGHLRVRGADL